MLLDREDLPFEIGHVQRVRLVVLKLALIIWDNVAHPAVFSAEEPLPIV